MVPVDAVSILALVAVCVFFIFSWLVAGRSPKKGIIVPLYDPPSGISPAMVRFAWKETFDDRAFWASALSLVAKGWATMESAGKCPVLAPRSTPDISRCCRSKRDCC